MKLIVALIPLALLAVTEGVTVYPIDDLVKNCKDECKSFKGDEYNTGVLECMCGQTPKNQEFSQCQQACVEANIDLDLAGKLDSGDCCNAKCYGIKAYKKMCPNMIE